MGDSKWNKGRRQKRAKANRPKGRVDLPINNRTTVANNLCASGKRRYPSEQRAWFAIEKINSNPGVELKHVYACKGGRGFSSCGGWHTTSMSRSSARKEAP